MLTFTSWPKIKLVRQDWSSRWITEKMQRLIRLKRLSLGPAIDHLVHPELLTVAHLWCYREGISVREGMSARVEAVYIEGIYIPVNQAQGSQLARTLTLNISVVFGFCSFSQSKRIGRLNEQWFTFTFTFTFRLVKTRSWSLPGYDLVLTLLMPDLKV